MVDMGDKGWLERLDHRQKPITDGFYGLTGLGVRGYRKNIKQYWWYTPKRAQC